MQSSVTDISIQGEVGWLEDVECGRFLSPLWIRVRAVRIPWLRWAPPFAFPVGSLEHQSTASDFG